MGGRGFGGGRVMTSSFVFFFVHPPVQSSTDDGERNHGNTTVRNGLTCLSI